MATQTTINETPQKETQPTTNSPTNTTTNNVPHPTIDLAIDDFLTLTPDETHNQSTPDKIDFSDDSMDQSPAVTSNHPLQTTFKRPRKASPDREDHVNNTSITKEQRNSAIRVFRELHRYNFRGVGKLQNLNTDKKKESSRRPCSLKLGNNSSNEHVGNYSHQKAIRPDPNFTKNCIGIQTLYSQIYKQLTKNKKPKSTKHNDNGVAIAFSENFKGKIKNVVNNNAGRIIAITFTLCKQNFHITTLHGLNKPHHRENCLKSPTNHITSTQNTVIGGDFNMVTEFRDRVGGTILNTHLIGSIPLN